MRAAADNSIREHQADEWRRVLFNAYTAGRFKKGVSFTDLLRRFGLAYNDAKSSRPQESMSVDEIKARAERIKEAHQRGE